MTLTGDFRPLGAPQLTPWSRPLAPPPPASETKGTGEAQIARRPQLPAGAADWECAAWRGVGSVGSMEARQTRPCLITAKSLSWAYRQQRAGKMGLAFSTVCSPR